MVKEYESGKLIVVYFLHIREDCTKIRPATVRISTYKRKLPYFYTSGKLAEYRR